MQFRVIGGRGGCRPHYPEGTILQTAAFADSLLSHIKMTLSQSTAHPFSLPHLLSEVALMLVPNWDGARCWSRTSNNGVFNRPLLSARIPISPISHGGAQGDHSPFVRHNIPRQKPTVWFTV